MKKIVAYLAFGLSTVLCVNAQTSNRPINITLLGGLSQYAGDLGNDFYRVNEKAFDNNRAFGLSLNHYINKHFDIGLMGTYGPVSFYENDTRLFKDYMTQANLHLKYKFGLPDENTFKPYIFLGTGVINHDGDQTVNGVEWMPVTGGGGINVAVSELITLQLQVTYGYWGNDNHDLVTAGDYNDAHLMNTLGLGFNLGSTPDADGDGIPDKKDKCPNTPTGSKVDKNGCPYDKDNDGVLDYADKCPDQAGTPATKGCPDKDADGVADLEDECPDVTGKIDLKGCPDADNDGIADGKDKCPNVKGVLEFEGCPDSDNDGVRDEEDKCPDIKGLKEFAGCPDTDGDGITDAQDQCPKSKGPANTNGCPDTDGDGVHDGIDRCPTIPGVASTGGCPELKKEIQQLFQKALQGIQFETGKAVIKPVSFPILDAVVKVMNENPSYKLLIGGHTDDVGKDEDNMTLSQNRADAVAKYLISKGVSPMRVAATGYGESQPVDSNKTKAGKARNRRVELKVEFLETVPQN